MFKVQQVKCGLRQGHTRFLQHGHVMVMASRQPVQRAIITQAAVDLDHLIGKRSRAGSEGCTEIAKFRNWLPPLRVIRNDQRLEHI